MHKKSFDPPASEFRQAPSSQFIGRGVILVVAAACGFVVANIYYNQPTRRWLSRSFLPGANVTALSQESTAKARGPSPIFITITALLLFGSITGPLEAQAAQRRQSAVPSLDIETGCKYFANTELNRRPLPELGPGIKPGHDLDYPGCITEEKTARAQLEGVWRTYPASQRQQCLYEVTPPALPSYVTLHTCLDMARYAEKLIKSDQNAGLGTAPNFAAPHRFQQLGVAARHQSG